MTERLTTIVTPPPPIERLVPPDEAFPGVDPVALTAAVEHARFVRDSLDDSTSHRALHHMVGKAIEAYLRRQPHVPASDLEELRVEGERQVRRLQDELASVTREQALAERAASGPMPRGVVGPFGA